MTQQHALTPQGTQVLEGTWEEIQKQAHALQGQRLRVIILEPQEQSDPQRLQALHQWLSMPRPEVPTLQDDSRSALYPIDEQSHHQKRDPENS